MSDKYQLKAILSAVDKMSPTLKGIAHTARTTRKYLLDVGHASGKLSSSIGLPFAALSGVLAGFSLDGMKEVITGYTEMANATKDGALQAGMAVDQYQRMKYVFDQSDISAESMVGTMGKLNKNIGEAAAGKNAELAGLFNHLGIATRDSNGQLRNAAELLPQIADAFKRNTNPAVQARMGMALFGKEWQQILPRLAEGSEGLKKSSERYDQLKTTIEDTDLDAADELNKKFKDLGTVSKSFSYTIARQLVPVIGPLVESFIGWATANKDIIAANVKQAVVEIVSAIKNYDWKGFFKSISDIASGFGKMVDMVGGAKNALIIFALVMNANAIMATFGMIAALSRLGLAFGGFSIKLAASTMQMYTFSSAASAMGGGLSATLVKLATGASLVAAAAAVGYAIGTAIYKGIEGTKLADNIGSMVAHTLAFFGNEDAKYAISHQPGTPTNVGRTGNAPWSPIAAGQHRVGGAIDINFNNAPPGMRIAQSQSSGPLDLNCSLGYRSYATGAP